MVDVAIASLGTAEPVVQGVHVRAGKIGETLGDLALSRGSLGQIARLHRLLRDLQNQTAQARMVRPDPLLTCRPAPVRFLLQGRAGQAASNRGRAVTRRRRRDGVLAAADHSPDLEAK